jgi:hypothetical protein
MTAPGPRTPGRLTGPALGMLLALAVLLMPVGYLAVRVWNGNNASAEAVAHQRSAVAFGRPMVSLMALLVDARSTAVDRITVEDSDIQDALNDINGLDLSVARHLGTGERMTELANEINRAVSGNPSGSDAVRVYATPIALAQDTLEYVLGGAHSVRQESTIHLLEVALRDLPQTIATAGMLSADITSGDSRLENQIRLGVGQDQVQRLANLVSTTLRGSGGHQGAAQFSADIRILKPLDTFSAAANELNQAAAELSAANPLTGIARTQNRERADTASNILRTSAVELAHALLDTFGRQLAAAAGGFATQRWLLTALVLVVVAAVAALMWLRFPWPPRRRSPEAEVEKPGRHGRPEGLEVRPDSGGLVDARRLLARAATDLGRAVGTRKR